MKSAAKIAIAGTALLLGCWIAAAPAMARPPTVTSSPGYDRRLVESRKALQPPAASDLHVAPNNRWKRHKRSH